MTTTYDMVIMYMCSYVEWMGWSWVCIWLFVRIFNSICDARNVVEFGECFFFFFSSWIHYTLWMCVFFFFLSFGTIAILYSLVHGSVYPFRLRTSLALCFLLILCNKKRKIHLKRLNIVIVERLCVNSFFLDGEHWVLSF